MNLDHTTYNVVQGVTIVSVTRVLSLPEYVSLIGSSVS